MSWRDDLCKIDDHEDGLIAHFIAHPVFTGMGAMSRSEVLDVLLQRRFLSLAFGPLYDMAIDGLSDESFKASAREILREEYGTGAQPTHREDLVHDLLALGTTRDQILSSCASQSTAHALAHLFKALQKHEDEALYQAKVLTVLRLAGEILVAIEYDQFWPQLQRLGLSASNNLAGLQSHFYYPHMCHDARKQRLSGERNHLQAMTHSDRLTNCLRNQLMKGPPEGVEFCIGVASLTQDIKRRFYDQFLRA